jgi:hypothetical protein
MSSSELSARPLLGTTTGMIVDLRSSARASSLGAPAHASSAFRKFLTLAVSPRNWMCCSWGVRSLTLLQIALLVSSMLLI